MVEVLRRRTPPTPMVRFILGLGLLAALHAAAVAYTRGAGLFESRPLSRYQDPLLLGAAANLFILLRFAAPSRPGRIAALLWTGHPARQPSRPDDPLHLPFKRHQDAISLAQVRAYLATNDPTVFTQEMPQATLHPNIAVVQRVLDDSQLHRVLPREFSDEKVRPPWLIECSPWLTLLGAVALLWVAIKFVRPIKNS